MKNAIAFAALAGLAAAASGQSLKMSFEADQSVINVGDTVNWTVRVDYTGLTATGYFGGFAGPNFPFGQFLASDSSLGQAFGMVTNMSGEAVPPIANGASISDINVFNSALLGTNDSSIGVFYSFSVLATSMGDLSYDASGTATLFASNFIFEPPIEFTVFPVNSDTVSIIPAPGAFALLGLGGLAAARRRR